MRYSPEISRGDIFQNEHNGDAVPDGAVINREITESKRVYEVPVGLYTVFGEFNAKGENWNTDTIRGQVKRQGQRRTSMNIDQDALAWLEAEIDKGKKKAEVVVVGVNPVGSHGVISETDRLLALEALFFGHERILEREGVVYIWGATNQFLARLAQKRWGFEQIPLYKVVPRYIAGYKDKWHGKIVRKQDITKNPINLETVLERQRRLLPR